MTDKTKPYNPRALTVVGVTVGNRQIRRETDGTWTLLLKGKTYTSNITDADYATRWVEHKDVTHAS